MTFNEFHSVWMLQKLKRRKKIESFEIKALRNIVKENSPYVVKNIENKFKEIRVEGKRKSLSSSKMYTETLPATSYTEAEQKKIEAMYMGIVTEARKRYQEYHSFSQQQAQSLDTRQMSFSRNFRYDPRSRFDKFKSPGRPQELVQCD